MLVGSCIKICGEKLTQKQRRQVYVCCRLKLSLQNVRKVKIPAILLQQFQSTKAKVRTSVQNNDAKTVSILSEK